MSQSQSSFPSSATRLKKANRLMGLIKRNFSLKNEDIILSLYWVDGGGVGSVMDCHSPRRDNAGSNPHATTDFSVTAEWPKTTHMLPRRPSINPDSRRTHPVNQE